MNRAQAHSPRSSQCSGEGAREPEVSATENVCGPEGRRLGFHNTGADAPWRAPCPRALPPGGALWSPLQRLLKNPSRRDDQQLLGPSLGSREVNSSGHTPGVNTKCSEEWGRLPQPLLAPLRGPQTAWLELAGEQRVQALELGQGLLAGRARVLQEMTTC